MEWWQRDGVGWLQAELPGARAAFSTAPLDVRDPAGRERLAAVLGIDPAKIVRSRQIHGADVIVHVHAQDADAPLPEADGHATAVGGLAPMVIVADCLPIAVRGSDGVAMLHGGWRGLAGGIVEHGVGVVGQDAAAAIGPSIGPCCYEVGEEVLASFEHLGDGIADGRMLNLREVARRLLERAGVRSVEISERCTSCDPDGLLHSHRRDGERAGRQAGIAWLS
jgi:YfiH family protein